MRLIDADEFKAFNARWMANEKDPEKKRARETRTQLFNTFIDIQKTIDAIPREELLNILNGRLDFLKKWKDETNNFKEIAEVKIEDCEEIIDIIKSYNCSVCETKTK